MCPSVKYNGFQMVKANCLNRQKWFKKECSTAYMAAHLRLSSIAEKPKIQSSLIDLCTAAISRGFFQLTYLFRIIYLFRCNGGKKETNKAYQLSISSQQWTETYSRKRKLSEEISNFTCIVIEYLISIYFHGYIAKVNKTRFVHSSLIIISIHYLEQWHWKK